MDEIDKQYIEKKLENIKIYSQELEQVFVASETEIKRDFLKYRTLERLLQLLVDEMIDVNNHFIKRLDLKMPDDFQSTFLILANNNILPEDFADRLAPVVGLRNRLVHRYEEVNLNVFLEALKSQKDDFRNYVKHIEDFLQ